MKALLFRTLYRVLIVLVLIVGLLAALVTVPLDLTYGLLVLIYESARIGWGDLVASAKYHVEEFRSVMRAFISAMRRGTP